MKRTWRAILALTLVCAVALTAAAMALGSKALPLTMTDACTIGDPAAAEGLHMAARIGMEQNRLQWRMDYDPAAGPLPHVSAGAHYAPRRVDDFHHRVQVGRQNFAYLHKISTL